MPPRHCLLAIFLALTATSASAQTFDADLELVLAVDVSRSMDHEELALQRDGYVAALRHPEVMAAIRSGPTGRIAITYVEWAGPFHQALVVPWHVIADDATAEAFAAALAAAPFGRERGTSISHGLEFAHRLFADSGVSGLRRAIDVSGDGPNNMGSPVAPMRDRIVGDGVTINGLPIMLKESDTWSPYSIPDLDIYYEDCVIGGPGAFMITVTDASGLAIAIRRKLVLEIAGRVPEPRVIPAAAMERAPRIDCLIGEKLRGRWLQEEPRIP